MFQSNIGNQQIVRELYPNQERALKLLFTTIVFFSLEEWDRKDSTKFMRYHLMEIDGRR
jgi:hypothetical protein